MEGSFPSLLSEENSDKPTQELAVHRLTSFTCLANSRFRSRCDWPVSTLVLRYLHVKCFWAISLSIDGSSSGPMTQGGLGRRGYILHA
jgi:hypothetical protein